MEVDINIVNKYIKDIQDKLDAGDYEVSTLSEFVKPIKYIYVQLPDLNVYLTPIKTSIDGHFYHKDYKDFQAPYVLINNNRFKNQRVVLDDTALAHEIQHFLDWKAGMQHQNIKNILKPEGGINPEYYNNPTEWRAFIIQILRQFYNRANLNRLPEDFKAFYKTFFRKTEARDFYNHLTPENKQRFDAYLQEFHERLKQKKRDELLEGMVSEEFQIFLEENQNIYSIYDLSRLMGRMEYDEAGQNILLNILKNFYRQRGDQGVIEGYKKMTGVDIFAIGKGRYVFSPVSNPENIYPQD